MSVESPETNTFYGKWNIMLLFNAYVYLYIIVPTNENTFFFVQYHTKMGVQWHQRAHPKQVPELQLFAAPPWWSTPPPLNYQTANLVLQQFPKSIRDPLWSHVLSTVVYLVYLLVTPCKACSLEVHFTCSQAKYCCLSTVTLCPTILSYLS